jgi:AraC-like DNA-binding protein
MKHQPAPQVEYRAVRGVAGVETLAARGLRTGFDLHFHDTYSFGIILSGVERCDVRRSRQLFEPGTVPMFNPGEVHDGGPATPEGWSYRMVPLADVASACGYADQSHLNRWFVRIHGTTPGRLRRAFFS